MQSNRGFVVMALVLAASGLGCVQGAPLPFDVKEGDKIEYHYGSFGAAERGTVKAVRGQWLRVENPKGEQWMNGSAMNWLRQLDK